MRPAIFITVRNAKTMFFSAVLKFLVVVSISATAILDSVFRVVIVNHFVKEGCGDLFDRSGNGSCSDVDFVALSVLGNPGIISEGEMTVSFWSGLVEYINASVFLVSKYTVETVFVKVTAGFLFEY